MEEDQDTLQDPVHAQPESPPPSSAVVAAMTSTGNGSASTSQPSTFQAQEEEGGGGGGEPGERPENQNDNPQQNRSQEQQPIGGGSASSSQEQEQVNQEDNHQQNRSQEQQKPSKPPENRDDNPLQNQSQEQQARSSIPSTPQSTTPESKSELLICIVLLLFVGFFASVILSIGFYGPSNIQLGPNCSRLIRANSVFVQWITAEELGEAKPAPIVYGFHKPPRLDVEITWTEAHNTSVQTNHQKEWLFFLNHGSRIDIQFNVKSTSYQTVMLVILRGKSRLVEWTRDQSNLDATLSWYFIHGLGRIKQEITESSDYYVALGNLYSEEVEIEMEFTVKSVVYNTTEAYYKCSLGDGPCSFKLSFLGTEAAVLTSPPHNEESPVGDDWFFELSYGARWLTYAVISGLMTMILLTLRWCCPGEKQSREMGPERAPLLARSDDNVLSRRSSSDSVLSSNEEDLEGEVCVICYNGPKACFFLPCGHSTCLECGKRIATDLARAKCPLCRKKIKKVGNIF